jgi:PmbA protein
MERDYEYRSCAYAGDLEDMEVLGRSAGERAVRRLNPRKMATARVPVIFDPRVANSFVGHLAVAANGRSIARGTSFLKKKMGEAILPKNITINDDPHRPRGVRSRAFDGEGLECRKSAMVKKGVLKSWFLDLSSARQLDLTPTAHATRGTSSPPGPTASNLYMEAGKVSPTELRGDIKEGLYVTEMMGSGLNLVTGDYSRGAGGFLIENGELTNPVSEITIAGNIMDMFGNLSAADDLEFLHGFDAPTLRIDGMTVAGS